MWGAVRSYESIDARPSTLRRLGVVALALVAGFVALSRTTALSPTAARDALLGASSGVGGPHCMPHCGDSYSYGYDDDDDDDDDGSDDDADDPCHHVDDDNNVIDYTPTPSKPPTVPTTHAPTQGHTTAPSAGPTQSLTNAEAGGKCSDDDDTVSTTTDNSKLHVDRTHTTYHHHHVDNDRNGDKTWDDDDHLLDDKDTYDYSYKFDTYCGLTIAKNTQSSANATASFQFYIDFLGAFCETDEDCKIGCATCGHAIRAALPGMTSDGGKAAYSCFGLHSVDATARPQGPISFDDAVYIFEDGLMDFARVTPFIDQSTMLYAEDGDTYVEWLAAEGKDYLIGEWYSESGTKLYSIITHVTDTMVCLEIITPYVKSEFSDGALKMNHVRLPDAAFTLAGIDLDDSGSSSTLVPLAVSKVTTNMYEVAEFYEDILLATEVTYSDSTDSAWGKVYKLYDAEMVIRFVQSKDDKVTYLENLKKETHNSSYASPWCGTDRYYDNHYAYSRVTAPANLSLVAIASRARNRRTRWHCENAAIYLWEPTGDMVYVTDATTEDTGTYAIDKLHDPAVTEDIAFCAEYGESQSAMCGQGYCDDSGLIVTTTDDDCG